MEILHLTSGEYRPTATLARHISGDKQHCFGAVTVTVHICGSYAHKEMDIHHFCIQLIIFPMYDPFIVMLVAVLGQECS